jgi:hypothetical protein
MSRRIRASEPAMTKNPERDGLIQINPVHNKYNHNARDIAHRKTQPVGALPGYDYGRAYAGFSHDLQKHSGNGIPDTCRDYTGIASLIAYRSGTGAGCGGGKDR